MNAIKGITDILVTPAQLPALLNIGFVAVLPTILVQNLLLWDFPPWLKGQPLAMFKSAPSLLAFALVLFFAVGVPSEGNDLRASGASGASGAPLVDCDGDGLDDILEVRIGTDPTVADTDQDGLTDLQEIMSGSAPLVYEAPGTHPPADTALYFNVYSNGQDFILDIYGQNATSIYEFQLVRALPTSLRTFGYAQLLPYFVDTASFASNSSGWHIDRIRYRLPASWFATQPTVSIAAQVVMDQAILAQAVTLTHAGSELGQLVWESMFATVRPRTYVDSNALGSGSGNSGNSNSGSGNPSGGLVPVDPGEGPPQSGTQDAVCLQSLEAIANLGAGRILYQVTSAACDPLPGALCLAGCSATSGDTVVGIDVVGLLGG